MPRIIAFDIEANQLLLKATTIWCIATQNIETGEKRFFGPTEIHAAIAYLQTADMLVAHNGVMYDVPVIERLYSCRLPKCLDTLLVSRLVFPDSYNHPLSGNSLADWGRFLGFLKAEYAGGFDAYSEDMGAYCQRDVELLVRIYEWQRSYAFKYKHAIKLEHGTAAAIVKQIWNGFTLDTIKAKALALTLKTEGDKQMAIMQQLVPPVVTTVEKATGWTTGEHTFKTIGEAKAFGYKRSQLTRVIEMVTTEEHFNPGSIDQLAAAMTKLYGWKPKVFSKASGKPKLDKDVVPKINNPLAQAVTAYRVLNKRSEFVESWLQAVTEAGRVHGGVITNGAPTGRMAHSDPNMAQIPKVGKPWGFECRDCWTACEGRVLVGADASGLELRMLAHDLARWDGGAYAKVLLEGDIHTKNQIILGFDSRDGAKTWAYAHRYGAGDHKLGSIAGKGKAEGARLRKKFEKGTVGFPELMSYLLSEMKKTKGYIFGLDGRPMPVRAEYLILNTRLQGNGAIVMKTALVIFDEEAERLYHGRWAYCANVHDEFQIESDPEIAKELGKMMVRAITKAGEVLNLRIRLDGEYKIGRTWAETH